MPPVITVCLLNYRRPKNIIHLLRSIEKQTVPAKIFIWDNSGGNMPPVEKHPLVKMTVVSSKNVGCFPRWWMASVADTEYVCSMDDDLVFRDENVLADALAASHDKCPDGIVGPYGWCHIDGKTYRASHHIRKVEEDERADIIKGRFMLFRRVLLKKVPLDIPTLPLLCNGLSHREDDIYVSLCIADGQWGRHLVPGILRGRFQDLARHGNALSDEPEHYGYRDQAVKAIRKWYNEKATNTTA